MDMAVSWQFWGSMMFHGPSTGVFESCAVLVDGSMLRTWADSANCGTSFSGTESLNSVN